MRAVQFFAQGDIRVQDVPEPKCKDDEIKVNLLYQHQLSAIRLLTPDSDCTRIRRNLRHRPARICLSPTSIPDGDIANHSFLPSSEVQYSAPSSPIP